MVEADLITGDREMVKAKELGRHGAPESRFRKLRTQ